MVEAPERTADGMLLRRYQAGDESAFTELRARYERLVYSTCRRETGDTALAEDATQAVFLLLIRKSFPTHATLAGWLHGASRLVSKNLLRAENRRRRWESLAAQEYQEPEAAWDAVSPFVDAALASLEPADREAILLRYVSDLSLAEVGQSLRISENTARMRVNRALERLRLKLRQAGVGLTALLLATLLSSRFADAAPTTPVLTFPRSSGNPVGVARLPWWLVSSWKVAVVSGLFAVGGMVYWNSRPTNRLGPTEAGQLFRTLESPAWAGTLEYADDRTGQHTKTDVNLAIDRPNDGLRVTATYPTFKNIDTTSFVPLADGRFRIENGGPNSSHQLDGNYELFRMPGNAFEFRGFSFAVKTDVRLTVRLTNNTLTLAEDVLRDGEYRFRNRFEVHRTSP